MHVCMRVYLEFVYSTRPRVPEVAHGTGGLKSKLLTCVCVCVRTYVQHNTCTYVCYQGKLHVHVYLICFSPFSRKDMCLILLIVSSLRLTYICTCKLYVCQCSTCTCMYMYIVHISMHPTCVPLCYPAVSTPRSTPKLKAAKPEKLKVGAGTLSALMLSSQIAVMPRAHIFPVYMYGMVGYYMYM